MDVTNMTKAQMIDFIKSHPNVKVSHWLFDDDEYIFYSGGRVYSEEGYVFEDWSSDGADGLRVREGAHWESGWSVLELAGVNQQLKELQEHIDKALEICDRLEFFGGQRAGRELWSVKPTEVQDEDIANFNKDVNFIEKTLLNFKSILTNIREL